MLPAALIALGLGATGCEPKEVSYKVKVVTLACQGPGPLEGADAMRLRITGPGIDLPLESESPTSTGELQVPSIPAGVGRVIELRALNGRGATAQVVAVGKSLPFDVPEAVPGESLPEISVFLRRVNSFAPPSSSQTPGTCTTLTLPRAGHTATLLADGRVYIAGGYQAESNGAIRRALSEAEIYDPATGTFTATTEMVRRTTEGIQRLPRAFHQATLLSNGQVLITGGRDTLNQAGSTYAVRSGVLFDAPSTSYLGFFNLELARSHHAAVKDRTGRVLIIGGRGTDPGSVVDAVEYYDPDSTKTLLTSSTVKRVEMSAVAVQAGEFIAVAGGSDGALLRDDVLFFSYDETAGTFRQRSSTLTLREKRRAAGVASFQEGNGLLLTGGYSTAESAELSPVPSSEIISTKDNFARRDGPALSARGDACAAVMADGRVMVAGGRAPGSQSVSTAELIVANPDGTAQVQNIAALPSARHYMTCTPLLDGSVLVVGGVRTLGTTTETLSDAFIYTPVPRD
jgi:hypothetical protein